MRLFWALAVLVVLSASAAAERVTLRVGTQAIDGSRYMQDILALSAEIAKQTSKRVQLAWSSEGRLGDDAAMIDLVTHGKLDGGGFSETGLAAAVPEMAAWRYPGLFRDYAEVDRATAALDATVREKFAAKDLVFLMWADLGFSHVFSTERITSVRDVLARASPWITMQLDAKLTTAVTTGKARAWALPPLYMLAIGRDQTRAMSELRYRYVVGGLVVSNAAWAKLSAEDQKTVLAICREWQPRLRASWRRESERGIAALAKSGVAIHTPTAAELATFARASATSRDTHAASAGLADLVGKIVAASVTSSN